MKFNAYRAVSDLIPTKNDPYFVGNGIFGKGTYFRQKYRPNTSFGEMGESKLFLTITKFEIESTSFKIFDFKNTLGLEDALELTLSPQNKKVHSEKLSSLFKNQELLIFPNENTDGGEQILLVPKQRPSIKKKSFSIVSEELSLIKKISKTTKIKISKTILGHYQVKGIPLKYESVVEKILIA